jgi:hypothetical protein
VSVSWGTDAPKTGHYRHLNAAGRGADGEFGEDLSHLTPEEMVAKLSEGLPPVTPDMECKIEASRQQMRERAATITVERAVAWRLATLGALKVAPVPGIYLLSR